MVEEMFLIKCFKKARQNYNIYIHICMERGQKSNAEALLWLFIFFIFPTVCMPFFYKPEMVHLRWTDFYFILYLKEFEAAYRNYEASLVAQTVKDPPAKQETRFNPWDGKIPWRRESSPLQYSCLKNSMDRGA